MYETQNKTSPKSITRIDRTLQAKTFSKKKDEKCALPGHRTLKSSHKM